LTLASKAGFGADGDAKFVLGKTIFTEKAEPKCAICHTLADAGSVGEIGPSLDELKPSAERVKTAVVNGVGVMPAFEGLSEEEIDAVAHYVSVATGGAAR
jgi:mono/diheme cytochrome c family protein